MHKSVLCVYCMLRVLLEILTYYVIKKESSWNLLCVSIVCLVQVTRYGCMRPFGCFNVHDLCVARCLGVAGRVQAIRWAKHAWFALMQSHSRTPWHDFECLEHEFGLMLHQWEDVHARQALHGVSHCKAMRRWPTAWQRMVLALAPRTTALLGAVTLSSLQLELVTTYD